MHSFTRSTRSRRAARVAALISTAIAFAGIMAVTSCAQADAHARRAHRAHVTSARRLRGLTLGFSSGADQLLASSNASTYDFWTERADQEGTQMVRLAVYWTTVAPPTPPDGFVASDPSSPGYRWASLDAEVQQLAASGFKILITVVDAPTWAEGANMPTSATAGTWEPSPSALAAFATALATRYDGSFPDPDDPTVTLPAVRYWQAWNEPNLSISLAPQWTKSGKRYLPASPALYRQLQNGFYNAVKAVSSSNYVVAAGTAPYGDPPGGARMQPVTFDRTLFCLTTKLKRASGCAGPTYLDAIDTHPYEHGTLRPTNRAYYANDVAIPDVHKLTRLLKAAVKLGTVRPAGSKGTWVTELGWQTDPPNPQGVASKTVARWIEQALYILWEQGVSTVLYYQLGDTPNPGFPIDMGVYDISGNAKPGATAFRFPFIGVKRKRNTVLTWGRSPAAGTLVIQAEQNHRWRTVGRVRVSARQVFETSISIRRGSAELRASVDGVRSLSWSAAK